MMNFGKVLAKLTKLVNYMLLLLMVLMVKPTLQTTGQSHLRHIEF